MCVDCEWEDTLTQIEEMLDSGDYDWAQDTLQGISDTVSDREHVTERQQEAIDNIENSKRN